MAQLGELAAANDADGFRSLVDRHSTDQKAVDKLTARIRIATEICPTCHGGNLVAESLMGQGENLQVTVISTTPVSPDFGRGLV